jgi:1,4-dihydroxy-6-naphthoate synthase
MSSTPATPDVFTLGHSPDPDDAFMFYAMAEQKIDLRGHKFRHILQDIQTLNDRATRGELHISAISIHAYAHVLDKYALLPCGASMGDGYGPVVIAASRKALPEGVAAGRREAILEWLKGRRVAVPGRLTSAFLSLQIYCGRQPFDFEIVPFDEIFDAVRSGKSDAGLIIHEGQLTYQRDGFGKVVDLGEWWKAETGLPLPLGGNVVRKDLSPALRKELSDIMSESIAYGLAHRAAGVAHAMPLARGMDTPLADRFIGMYVNDFTRDYGDVGRQAIREFLGRAAVMGFIPAPVELEFVE